MIEGQAYESGDTWRAYSLDLTASPYVQQRTSPLLPTTAGTWHGVAQAYARYAVGDRSCALTPGLVQWLHHLAGDSRFAFHGSWVRAVGRAFRGAVAVTEGDNGEQAACFGAPDIGDGLRWSRGRQFPLGWLLFELGLRRTRRLRVFPAAAPAGWSGDQLHLLYAKMAQAAASTGFRWMDVAPVAEDDKRSVAALHALGARPAQQFTIYVKAL
jgi:hypothetical protein